MNERCADYTFTFTLTLCCWIRYIVMRKPTYKLSESLVPGVCGNIGYFAAAAATTIQQQQKQRYTDGGRSQTNRNRASVGQLHTGLFCLTPSPPNRIEHSTKYLSLNWRNFVLSEKKSSVSVT